LRDAVALSARTAGPGVLITPRSWPVPTRPDRAFDLYRRKCFVVTDDTREELYETTPRDHALAIGLAALNAIPVAGGTIATLISEYVPREKQERMKRFVQDLGERLSREQARVDQEFVRTDEFQTLFEDTLDRVQQRRNEDKFEYWASLVTGVVAKERPPRADRDRFVDTLDRLRLSHLQLLHVVATTTTARPGLYMGGVSDTLTWKLPATPIDEIRRDWDDLARESVLQSYPSGLMSAEGAGNLTVRVTPYGQQFIRLLQLEKTDP
jgi:hypothetical protein